MGAILSSSNVVVPPLLHRPQAALSYGLWLRDPEASVAVVRRHLVHPSLPRWPVRCRLRSCGAPEELVVDHGWRRRGEWRRAWLCESASVRCTVLQGPVLAPRVEPTRSVGCVRCLLVIALYTDGCSRGPVHVTSLASQLHPCGCFRG